MGRLLLIAGLSLLALQFVYAEEPSVTAVLDSSETAVDQPVQLQIKVTGARRAQLPNQISVDGLDIRYTGESQSIEMRNFSTSMSIVYNYTIMPVRAGTFRIPPQTIRIGEKTMRTPELALNVANASGGRSAGGAQPRGTTDASRAGFIELTVAKTSAYIGEVVPVQVRLGFDRTARVQAPALGPSIDIPGQGFVAQKMPKPTETAQTIRGVPYETITYKTAIAAARSGKLEIGPVELPVTVWVPQRSQRRPATRDPFGLNDPFFDNFFNDPMFAPGVPREVKLKSETATLDVKPLPPNAPPNFSGAVGTFTLTAEAKPMNAQIGDPITVTAKITGRGNFDRMTSPVLEDERGWHSYPPSAQFKQDDDVGISGTKTFDIVLSANERKDKIPPLIFSFFDPAKEQYVTLRSDPIAVKIQGGVAPSATPAAVPSAQPAASPATVPTATPAAKSQDILYQLNELPARAESFTPMFARRSFWLVQLVPLIVLLGFIGVKVGRARLNDREARRLAMLQHEAADLQRKLHHAHLPPQEYFADASRAVQLKTAMIKNLPPHAVDADTAASAFRVDEMTRQRLQQLFARSDELRYSGAGNGASTLSPDARRDVLNLLDQLRT